MALALAAVLARIVGIPLFVSLAVVSVGAIAIWIVERRPDQPLPRPAKRSRDPKPPPRATTRGSHLVPRTPRAKVFAVGVVVLTLTIAVAATLYINSSNGTPKTPSSSSPRVLTSLIDTHNGPVRGVKFSPDGTILATTASDDSRVQLWTSAGNNVGYLATLTSEGPGRSLAFSPNGNLLATASTPTHGDASLQLWNVATRKATTLKSKGSSYSLALNRDGILASANTLAGASTYDNSIHLWDLTQNGRIIATLPGHTNGIESLDFSPDGKTLASGGSGGNPIRLWNVATGKITTTLNTGFTEFVGEVAFSPDGKTLAGISGSSGGNPVQLWNVATGKRTATFTAHPDVVNGVGFGPDGEALAASAGADGTVRLWNVATGKLTAVLTGETTPATGVAFSPDGKTVATGHSDGRVLLWDIPT